MGFCALVRTGCGAVLLGQAVFVLGWGGLGGVWGAGGATAAVRAMRVARSPPAGTAGWLSEAATGPRSRPLSPGSRRRLPVRSHSAPVSPCVSRGAFRHLLYPGRVVVS